MFIIMFVKITDHLRDDNGSFPDVFHSVRRSYRGGKGLRNAIENGIEATMFSGSNASVSKLRT